MTSLARKLLPTFVVFLLGVNPCVAGITVVYDFAREVDKAKVTAALTAKNERVESGGAAKQSLFLHPTTGDARAEYTVEIPAVPAGGNLILAFSAGLKDGFKTDDKEHPFDGVDLAVEIQGTRVWELKGLQQAGWQEAVFDLSGCAGKAVTIAFISNPRGNSNYDWSVFGEPRILALSGGCSPGPSVPAVKGIVLTTTEAGFTLSPLNPAGAEMSQPKTYRTWGFSAIHFNFTKQRAHSVQAFATSPGSVRIFAYDPQFEITALGPSRGVVFAGDRLKVRAIVKNTGEGPFTALQPLRLQMGDDDATRQELTALFPSEEQTIEWPWDAPSVPQVGFVWIRAVLPFGGEGITVTSSAIVTHPRTAEFPAPRSGAAAVLLKDGSAALLNDNLLLLVLPREAVVENNGAIELPAALLYTRKENKWERIGSIAPLGKLWIDGLPNTGSAKVKLKTANLKGSASVEAFATAGGRVLCSVAFSAASKGGLTFSSTANLKKGETLRVFAGPAILAGDGAFGAGKDEAIFPGLEYLVKGERSSGRDFAHPPFDLRVAPHPNKVTIPVMAVRDGRTLISLTWDPLQRWDGEHDRPSAVFASPNFITAQENHLMGLFLPSIPGFTPENSLSGKYTAQKDTKLVLSGTITVTANAKTVLDAVTPAAKAFAAQRWLPLEKVNFQEVERMCVKSLSVTAWDPEKNAWRHTNTGPVFFDPMIALPLWQYSHQTADEGQRQNLRKLVMEAVEKAEPGQVGLDLAMHVGNLEKVLTAVREHVHGLIRSQRPDGSWAYTPDEKHSIFGRPGDSSSGWSASIANTILRYVRITGDRQAQRAGLKALQYLDTQSRPEGAQTWELQLHVPDILAAAYAAAAYIEGYRITGDKRYLEKASYWAKSGLPFVYLWNTPDRNIMRFGTIPVFGVTWFDIQPWFGVMVQWCGLAYAYELQQLAPLDDSFPWQKIAEGITTSAYQQQKYITKEYPSDYGMYPDAYSPVKGKEEYHWDLNPRFVAKNVCQILGHDPYIQTVVLKSESSTITISTVGKGLKASLKGNLISIGVSNGPNTTTYILIANVGPPAYDGAPPVVVDGAALNAKADLLSTGPGFKYLSDTNQLIIKMENRSPRTQVEVRF